MRKDPMRWKNAVLAILAFVRSTFRASVMAQVESGEGENVQS